MITNKTQTDIKPSQKIALSSFTWAAGVASRDPGSSAASRGEACTVGHASFPSPYITKDPAWYPDIQPFNIPQAIKLTPGYGDPHPKCGQVRFKILCSNDPSHYEALARETCHRPACPTCSDTWVSRAAQDAFFRVEGHMKATNGSLKPRHISLNPSNDLIKGVPQDQALKWLYDEGRRLVQMLGLTAVLPIPHPYRIRPEKRDEISRLADKHGMNRYQYALSQPGWRDLVYYSPHLHLIAYGHLMPSVDFYNLTGWTYRNHDKHGGRTSKDLEKTIAYLLTHAWVNGNHKICRYWLGLSTHNLSSIGGGYNIEPVLCPVCSAACVQMIVYPQFDGSFRNQYQDFDNAPVATKRVRYSPHYEVRMNPALSSIVSKHDPPLP